MLTAAGYCCRAAVAAAARVCVAQEEPPPQPRSSCGRLSSRLGHQFHYPLLLTEAQARARAPLSSSAGIVFVVTGPLIRQIPCNQYFRESSEAETEGSAPPAEATQRPP